MSLNEFLGLLTAIFFFAPVVLILATGLYVNKSLLSLGLYCLMSGAYQLLSSHLFKTPEPIRVFTASLTNYLDAPLMLGVLLLYCHTPAKRRRLLVIAVLFIVYELVVGYRFGMQRISSVYTSGVGLSVVFLLGVYFFVVQLQQTIRFGKGMGRTLIAAAVFFAYGIYELVYVLFYLKEIPQVADVFLLYYLASLFFCILVTAGLVQLYRQHRKVVQLIRVRRELAAFFHH